MYDYEIDYPLVDDVPFHTVIQEVGKQLDRIVKQFHAENKKTNGYQFDVSVPTSYGDHDIHMKLLGVGGYGIAYQLTIKDQAYVLKIVIHEQDLAREIDILKKLKGKWFALQLLASSAIHKKDNSGDVTIYMLYPYIKGVTLHDYMEDVDGYDKVREKMNHILQGLHELHQMGIVHADIKEENIWIPEDPSIRPFFLDFGGSHLINAKYTPVKNYRNLGFMANSVLRYSRNPTNLKKNLIKKLKNEKVTYNNIEKMTFGGKRATKKRSEKRGKTPKKRSATKKR